MTITATQRTLAAALLAPMSLSVAAQAAPDSAALKLLTAPCQRSQGRLIRVGANGNHLTFPISIEAHWFPGVLRILLEVALSSRNNPASWPGAHLPVHVLLEMRPNGDNLIQIAHPGDKTPVTLPFEKWSDGQMERKTRGRAGSAC